MTLKLKYSVLSAVIISSLSSLTYAADIVDVSTLSITSSTSLAQDIQLDANSRYQVANTVNLPNHHTKYRLQQYYQGVPVFGYTIVAAKNTSGSYSDLNGLAVTNFNLEDTFAKPNITAEQALDLSLPNSLASNAKQLKRIQNKESKLWVYLAKDNTPKLVYITSYFNDISKPTRPFTIVDAHSGKILDQWEGLETDAIGTGAGGNLKTGEYQYGTDRPKLDVTQKGDSCTMENAVEKTVDYKHWHFWTSAPIKFNCPEHNEKVDNGAYGVANDAHYYGGIVFKMYHDWLNTRPIKQQLVLKVHYQFGLENAMYNGKSMNFGDGATMFYPLVSLDVTSHEVSHGFTQQHSNLIYKGQSGGMNEAFSDMAGEAAKFYAYGKNNFEVGDTIVKKGGALRYMDDPTKDHHSIGSAKDYKSSLNVHYTSGVYNKAFYTLATTNGWDTKKAFQTFATANELYWNATSNFQSGACGVIKAAKDLNFNQDDVANAFSAVDINNPC